MICRNTSAPYAEHGIRTARARRRRGPARLPTRGRTAQARHTRGRPRLPAPGRTAHARHTRGPPRLPAPGPTARLSTRADRRDSRHADGRQGSACAGTPRAAGTPPDGRGGGVPPVGADGERRPPRGIRPGPPPGPLPQRPSRLGRRPGPPRTEGRAAVPRPAHAPDRASVPLRWWRAAGGPCGAAGGAAGAGRAGPSSRCGRAGRRDSGPRTDVRRRAGGSGSHPGRRRR